MYRRSWSSFESFVNAYRIATFFPVWDKLLTLYITHLFDLGYAASSIATQTSAIGFVHKLQGLPDPTQSFLVRKALAATRKGRRPKDKRLPITACILQKLMLALPRTEGSGYRYMLFRAMFLLAFHAFLRVGEITQSHHNLQLAQIQVSSASVNIKFNSFKHSDGVTVPYVVSRQGDQLTCPVKAMSDYLSCRGCLPGPVFTLDGKPVSRRTFVQVLQSSLQTAGVSHQGFNSHSFRIGAATTCAQKGASDAQIRTLGRWKSDAFKVYIHPANPLQV